MLDPIILRALSIGFALLFLLAAIHKISSAAQFRVILQEYRILPEFAVGPATKIVPAVEVLLGIGWLTAASSVVIATASALLIAMYTTAIAINLMRGRVHISCGCNMAGTDDNDQRLTWGLVLRNVLLASLALVATIPVSDRMLGAIDYVTLAATVLAAVLLYSAGNQLLSNYAAIGTWRNNND